MLPLLRAFAGQLCEGSHGISSVVDKVKGVIIKFGIIRAEGEKHFFNVSHCQRVIKWSKFYGGLFLKL